MLRIFIALGRLLYAVWRVDRVRISRTEGCLNRLSVDGLMLVDGEAFLVIDQRRVQLLKGPCLEYDCRSAKKKGTLRVFPYRCDLPDRILWRDEGCWTKMHPARITVFFEGSSPLRCAP